MKKSIIIIALACAMIFAFAGTAMADHSPQFYFNWQAGTGVTDSPAFQHVFPTEAGLVFSIDNGYYDPDGDGPLVGTASPHKTYSQTTAKCGVCHSVHRAPTRGTSSSANPTVSSRYALTAYTSIATPDTQLLLKSTANGSCAYCHISGAHGGMYGGDVTMAWTQSTDPEYSWNEFYGHTNGCTSCHAVHGAYTLPGSKILKYQGVKSSGSFALQVQPELYSATVVYDADPAKMVPIDPIFWASKADMIAGTTKPLPGGDGAVDLAKASVTALCSICHANYSSDNNALINADLQNLQLFQGASWDTPNGSAPAQAWVPGVTAGGWRTGEAPAIWNTFSMMYKNHPMKNADAKFSSPGATGNATDGPVSAADSYYCQSCHDAPTRVVDPDGGFAITQSFPHYTPGYYKFIVAQDQSKFATPNQFVEVNFGRIPFYEGAKNSDGVHVSSDNFGEGPAIMNDGYCIKCHTEIGLTY